MSSCLYKAFFILAIGLTVNWLPAQELPINSYSNRQGLSQGFTADILQDSEGFLWAGTKNGLNRFDGRRFKVFRADADDPYAISHELVLSLWEKGDFLLVGTEGGGLNIFHKKTQRFFQLPDSLPGAPSRMPAFIDDVAADAQGNIWLVDRQIAQVANLYQIVVPPGFWEQLPESPEPWAGITVKKPGDYVASFFFLNPDGSRLYFAKEGVLAEIDTRTGQQHQYRHPGIDPYSYINHDLNGHVWVTTRNALLRLEENSLVPLATDFPVGKIFFTGPGKMLVQVHYEKEVYFFNLENLPDVLRLEDAVMEVDVALFRKAMTDRSGNIWIATNGNGLKKINPQRGRFQTFLRNSSVSQPLIPVGDDAFIIAAPIKGNFIASRPLNRHPFLEQTARLPFRFDYRSRSIRDRSGNYWLLFYYYEDKDVNLLNSHLLLRIAADGSSSRLLPLSKDDAGSGNLILDDDGFIWIGLNGTLYRLDPDSEQITSFSYREALPKVHDVRMLVARNGGGWWLGTTLGLVEAVPNGAGFDFHLHASIPGDPNSLRNDDIACLLADPNDPAVIWIGTKGGGASRFDTRSGAFFHLSTRNYLPDNTIYGILADDQGFLWMSSNNGLIRYEPGTHKVRRFTTDDGLQDEEFNTLAFGKTPSGKFLFGGIKGLNVFDPKDFKDNRTPPSVFLTGLNVKNAVIRPRDSTYLLQQAIEYTNQIRLPFKNNSIELEFAALEFTSPEKNRFRYYLEGAEKEWANEGNTPGAQYLNLPPGSYTFKVMASNGDGIWNEKPRELQITILPPWYRSWLAYLTYLALTAGLLLAFYRNRQRQWELKQALALEHREAERIRELDQFKSRLFTNITHEFRTPLTVILGTAEHLEQQPEQGREILKNRLALIRRNGSSLLNLVNQLLDLAKAESNQLKVDMVQADVVRYLRYITESFHSLANQRNVLLRVESQLAEQVMDFDPEKMRQILSNLISNALKYTPSGGQVRVRLSRDQAGENSPFLILEVTDTGEGIPAKDLPHIFDRFYRVDTSVSKAGGTGIGLALTRELVKLLGGEISAHSIPGQGATFTVRLPITHHSAPSAALPEHAIPEQAAAFMAAPVLPIPEMPENKLSGEGSPSVLVIEDNPDVVEYLRICLEGYYQLDFAFNGRAGIDSALETVPDLIISDVMMPEKDGFEVCDTLKNDERSSHIPIVLLTAKADVESRIAGLRRGADAYLAKPFHPEELLVTLEKLLENRRRLQERFSRLAAAQEVTPAPEPGIAQEDAFLQKLRAILEERLDDPDLSVEEVGRKIGMGRSNLYAKLSALTGMSFNIYLRTLRLNRAKTLLETSDLNVSEVAYQVGFSDPKYFSRLFSDQFGVAPSAVRKN